MHREASLVLSTLLAFAGAASASPVSYTLDPQHTFPTLEFPHMEISTWRGRFNETSGRLVLDMGAKTGEVNVRVATASIDFGLESMRDFAVQPDWLDTAKYPEMTYAGKLVFDGERPTAVDGQLTLRGVTRPLRLKITKFGCTTHPAENRERCGADAEGALERADYGMSLFTEGGAGHIVLRIQVEALRDDGNAGG